MNAKQLFVFFGIAMMLFGVYAPAISIPIIGTISFIQYKPDIGQALLVLGTIAAVLTGVKIWPGVISMALICSAAIFFSFIELQNKISGAMEFARSNAHDNPFVGLLGVGISAISPQFGWVIMGAGCVLMIVGVVFDIEKLKIQATSENSP